MSNIVIKATDISKQYRLGLVGTGTLKDDMARFWAKIRGKEDPTLTVGQVNDRTKVSESDYVWALKDINFEVKQGEILGIIGKNGAGKSTLLKILSKITAPTTGSIKVKGRIASLLEVGTGFHGELTGRENIYINGAVLGMSRREVNRKLDEIVDFAGVDKYIDTPVKRYSSGMTVRLGFAVAAHLDPDILVVDEVLTVGDAEFQKKAIGKMQDVSNEEGRTILFVSHNMTSVTTLCTRGMYLKQGQVESVGNVKDIIGQYLSSENATLQKVDANTHELPENEVAKLLSARIINKEHDDISFAYLDDKIGIEYTYLVKEEGHKLTPNVHVFDSKQEYIFVTGAPDEKIKNKSNKGIQKSIVWIPSHFLNIGTYIIGLALSTMAPVKVHFYAQNILSIDIIENINKRESEYISSMPGVIRPKLIWEIENI